MSVKVGNLPILSPEEKSSNQFFFYFYLCMWVFAFMCVCEMCGRPKKSEVGFPRTGVIGGCEPLYRWLGTEPWFLASIASTLNLCDIFLALIVEF